MQIHARFIACTSPTNPTRGETATLRLGRPSSGAAVAASKLNSGAQAAAAPTVPLTLTLQQFLILVIKVVLFQMINETISHK